MTGQSQQSAARIMAGKRLNLKCRLVVDNLNLKRPPQLDDVKIYAADEELELAPEPVLEPEPEAGPSSPPPPDPPVASVSGIPPRPKKERLDGLDVVDTAYFHCAESDVKIITPKEEKEIDITGSILELEQDEISTPKGARKGKLQKSPDFPRNPHWIKPEDLMHDICEKKRNLKNEADDPSMFTFPCEDWVMNSRVWQIPELMALKAQLNEVKALLDSCPLSEWHTHTKSMNIAHLVMPYVKKYFNPEFSSQAWGKLFEILCAYDIIPYNVVEAAERKEKIPFDSIHLCEAPGAFVSALNHFLKISYPTVDWKWLATTLNPYHEANDVGKMINDDRLILRSLDKWTFLGDSTGNILVNENLKFLLEEQEKRIVSSREAEPGVKNNHTLLVTADGSIDCQINPAEQEKMVAHLQYGEIVTALRILQPGGSFVLKIFTFLEAWTICHLYLLSCVFKEVHLYKPSTSKEGNSEVYVICIGYLGGKALGKNLRSLLVDNLETYGENVEKGIVLLPLSAIPATFIRKIQEAAEFFCSYQMKIIRRNHSCFPCDTRMYQLMRPYRREIAEQWIEWCAIRPLPSKHRLFSSDMDDNSYSVNRVAHLDVKEERGCFLDKMNRTHGNHMQKIAYIKEDLLLYTVWNTQQNHTLYGGLYKIGSVVFEKPYRNIRSSRFCHGRLLSARQELREIVQEHEKQLELDGLNDVDNMQICTGHSFKRIYESMAKSCDVVLNNLQVVCFMKLTWNLVFNTDFVDQRNDLKKLIEAVKELEKERSLFLCRYPLLTRLQNGFLYCLAGLFEKVILYVDPARNVTGILLHKFKGVVHPDQKRLFQGISDVLNILEDDDFERPVLEIVTIKTLMGFLPVDFILNYNHLLITQDMLRTINVVEGVLKI